MLLIPCPFCGPRAEIEFTWGGAVRSTAPSTMTDTDWGEYLYVRDNSMGVVHERWVHAAGCRQWFVIERNTLTHQIVRSTRLNWKPVEREA